jgi:4-hydroxy-tetrahydrodipicolinate synthase
MFQGSIVALVTPFDNNQVDESALRRLVRYHIEHGTNAIVPVGTTGESATLSQIEHEKVVELVVEEAAGALPVIAGAGSNNPTEAIHFTHHAERVGADAALHVAGYYNRPNQEGLYQHFAMLDSETNLPVLAYNVPRRTIVDIEPETMARIAQLGSVIGVKDASCDLSRPIREGALITKPFCFLSGEDNTAVAYNAQGGQGCIAVTANVAPALCAEMQAACLAGDFKTALAIQTRLMPLREALFREPSPAGAKYACSLLGLISEQCRVPIVPLTDDTKQELRAAMLSLELI